MWNGEENFYTVWIESMDKSTIVLGITGSNSMKWNLQPPKSIMKESKTVNYYNKLKEIITEMRKHLEEVSNWTYNNRKGALVENAVLQMLTAQKQVWQKALVVRGRYIMNTSAAISSSLSTVVDLSNPECTCYKCPPRDWDTQFH